MKAINNNNINNNKKITNKSYGILSLRGGVFMGAFGSIALTPLVPFSTSSNDYVSRYFSFRLPGIKSPFDGLIAISFVMNAVGMLGCYKKSRKLIKYHKYYCYYESVCTPLVIFQSLLCSYWNIGAILKEKNATWESFRVAMKEEYGRFVFIGFATFMGTCCAQLVYASYVTRQYEKFLELEASAEEEK